MPSPKFYRAPFQTQNPAALIDDNLFKFHPTEPTVGTQDQIHQKLLEFLPRHPCDISTIQAESWSPYAYFKL